MADQQPDTSITTAHRESVEVLTPDGKTVGGASALSNIFDKVEQAKERGEDVQRAINEVMTSQPDETPSPAKTEEPAKPAAEEPPAKEEVKDDSKNLDEALTRQEEVKAPAEKKDEDVPEEELTVLSSDKPKTAKRIQALLKKVTDEATARTQTQKERDEQSAKVKELEDKLSKVQTVDPKTQEEVKAKLSELDQYRRRYELEKDPAVQEKFDNRIKESGESIIKLLSKHGAGEGLTNIITEEGGWAKFADSKRLVPINGEDRPIPASELAKRILSALPYSEQKEIDRAVSEELQLKKEKERYFDEEKKKATEFFSQRELTQKQQQEANAKAHEEAVKTVNDFHANLVKNNDWLTEKPVPSNATAEQRAAIEEGNKWAKQIDSERQRYLKSKTLPEILAVVEDAVKYHNERRKNASLEAQLKASKETVEKLRSAGRSTAKGGGLAAGGAAPAPSGKAKPQTLEDAFNKIAETGSVDE